MSEYIRMVSYFYRYQNGGKQENAGFGKVENHSGRLRITLRLNDLWNALEQEGEVYFYQYEHGNMRLYPLGKASFNKGMLQFRKEFSEEYYVGGGHDLRELSGLIVYFNEQLFYGSQWSEEPIYIEALIRARTSPVQKEVKSVLKENKENNIGTVQQEKSLREEMKQTFVRQPDEVESDGEEEALEATGEREQIRLKDKATASGLRDGEKTKLTGIPYLLKYRNPLPAFANNEVMQCVRIMPEDIGLMNRSNWDYGNNSFLMHGFYNYHYLLLGSMVYEDGARQYVLGVPGIYSGKDQYLAQIFGFRRFIPIRRCPYKTGEFGYWIAKLSD